MSTHQNGAKTFLFVVYFTRPNLGTEVHIIRADHNPDRDEIAEALHLGYDEMRDTLEAVRFSEDEVPTIPPKK